MSNNSKNSKANESPAFKTEAEAADWYASPAGKRHTSRIFQKAIREGKIITTESRTMSAATLEKAARTGSAIFYKNGTDVRRTDPAVLQKLLDDARASMTKAISLRIPIVDIEAAKAIAEKKGVGYQSVLKQAIHKGLRRA
jgi:hypothetical protein